MKIVKFLVPAAIVAAAVGGFLGQKTLAGTNGNGKAALGLTEEAKSETAQAASPASPAGPVPTATVEPADHANTVRLTGTLAADEKSDVASNANGIVEEIYIERGSMVEKGKPLLKLDPTDVKNMLAEGNAGVEELKAALGITDETKPYKPEDQPLVKAAKAGLDLATTNFNRYSELFNKGALARAAYDQAKTERDASEQRYQQAVYQARQLYQSLQTALTKIHMLKKALNDTVVVAPFSGLIAEKYVSVGERVTTNPMGAGAKVATIVKVDPLRLLLTVPQQHIELVKPGQEVKFKVDAFPDRTFEGEVRYVGPSLESISRSLVVEAVVPNPDGQLRPGYFATAELVLPETVPVFRVPGNAVFKQGDSAKVFVVRDGKAREQIVALGDKEKDLVCVTAGLANGDIVVTAPDRVHDGDKVN